jgi:Protein of unknown function (DUF1566)
MTATCLALGTSASAPPGRYLIANGTVVDTKTMLTWQQAAATATYNWANATSYCANLMLNGVSGWRLPTVKELSTLVDATQLEPIDLTAFPGTSGVFWSSTPYANFSPPPSAWTVDFSTPFSTTAGDTTNAGVTSGARVRCVK